MRYVWLAALDDRLVAMLSRDPDVDWECDSLPRIPRLM